MTASPRTVSIMITGDPATQGSTRAFVVAGRARVVHDNAKTKPWRQTIAQEVRRRLAGRYASQGPVLVTADFIIPRPPSHWRKDGTPRKGAPAYPRLDADKLGRALLDALTGVAYTDDSQVTQLMVTKWYQPLPHYITGVSLDITATWETRAGEAAA